MLPCCRGNACQGIDKQQICVSADAFLMACPEVQTLGLYPPASQQCARQSLLLKQREGSCFLCLINAPPSCCCRQEKTNLEPHFEHWGLECDRQGQSSMLPEEVNAAPVGRRGEEWGGLHRNEEEPGTVLRQGGV